MTRINLIPPAELHDKHLVAEYRELPRVFKLARPTSTPPHYVLGKGHVTFFYNKLHWLYKRQHSLVAEMRRRNFTVNFPPDNLLTYRDEKPSLWGDWTPSPAEIAINLDRINTRLHAM